MRSIFWALALIVGCSDVPASNPYDPQTPLSQQAPGQVSGRLLVPTGYELGGAATVALYSQADSEDVRPAPVSAEGAFALADVPAGGWRLEVLAPGFVTPPVTLQITLGGTVDLGALTLAPDLSAHLEGTVVVPGADENGHGGVTIEVDDRPQATFTRGSGVWALDVQPRRQTLIFRRAGFAPTSVTVTPAAHESVRVDVVLEGAPSTVRGGVAFAPAYATMGEARNITVILTRDDAAPSEARERTALEGGTFEFSGLAPGPHHIVATYEGFRSVSVPLDIPVGATISAGVLVLLPPQEAAAFGSVTGIAQRFGAPAGAHAGIHIEADGWPEAALTTSTGDFELRLPPGSYVVRASAESYSADDAMVVIDAGQTTRLSEPLVLNAQPGFVVGDVVFARGYETARAARDVAVRLMMPGNPAFIAQEQVHSEGGPFNFDGLSPGSYAVRAEHEAFSSVTVMVDVTIGQAAHAGTLVLVPPPPAALAVLTGIARRQGAAADGHEGIRIDVDGWPEHTTTEPDGAFALPLPVGPQVLRASAPGYGLSPEVSVEVVEGGTALAQPILLAAQPGSIRGHVALLPFDGVPFDPADALPTDIALYRQGSEQATQRLNPDAAGDFVFPAVAPGAWRLTATLEGFEPRTTLVDVGPAEDAVADVFNLQTLAAAIETRSEIRGTVSLDCLDCDHSGTLVYALGSPFASITTNNGEFALVVGAGDHELVFRHAGYVEGRRSVQDVEASQVVVLPPEPPIVLTRANGGLRGRVELSRFGTPERLGDAVVTVASGGVSVNVPVGAGGLFEVDGRPPGDAVVTATLAGYSAQSVNTVIVGQSIVEVGTLTLRHQSDTDEAVAFAGRVVDADGEPMAGAAVRVRFAAGGALLASTATDADGRFAVSSSPADAYLVEAERAGHAPSARLGPYELRPGGGAFVDERGAPPLVVLDPNPFSGRIRLSIRVLPSLVPPAERHADVRVVGETSLHGFNDAREGDDVTFENLPRGRYTVHVTRSGFRDVDAFVVLDDENPEADLGRLDLVLADLGQARVNLGAAPRDAAEFAGIGLAGADLSGARLTGNFNGLDLSGANLTNAIFEPPADGEGETTLIGTDLRFARLFGTQFAGLDLTDTRLDFAAAFGADFSAATLAGARLDHANFTAASLRGTRFVGVDEVPPARPCGPGGPAVSVEGTLFSQADLDGAEMSGVDLRGASLGGALLTRVDLTRACLREGSLGLTDLSEATLDGADLSGAGLAGSIFVDTSARGADLRGASLLGAIIERGDFGCATQDENGACTCAAPVEDFLTGGRCDPMLADRPVDCACRTSLDRANLDGANLVGARLDGATLSGAAMLGVNPGDALLADGDPLGGAWDCVLPEGCTPNGAEEACRGAPRACRVRPTSFAGALLDDADLSGVTLRHVDLSEARLQRAILNGVAFDASRLTGADLTRAELSGAVLAGQVIGDVVLTEAVLVRADLRDASLTDVSMRRADLTTADLSGATLIRVDLEDTEMDRTDLRGASCPACRMHLARLTGARLEGLGGDRFDLTNASLTDVDLADATLSELNATGLRVVGGDWARVHLPRARLTGASFEQTTFLDLDLTGANLTDAAFDRATFLGSVSPPTRLRQNRDIAVRFDNASVFRTKFHDCDWQGDPKFPGGMTVNFDCGAPFDPLMDTYLPNNQSVLVDGCFNDSQGVQVCLLPYPWPRFLAREVNGTVEGSSFRNCTLRNPGFVDDMDLRAVDFSGARIEGLHLRNARMEGARMMGTHARDTTLVGDPNGPEGNVGSVAAMVATGSVWDNCDFNQLNASGADFSSATFGIPEVGSAARFGDRTSLRGARFRGATGYYLLIDGAEFQPRIDATGTDFRDLAIRYFGADRVDFSNSDWRSASQPVVDWGPFVDLSGANVTGTDLGFCSACQATIRQLVGYSRAPQPRNDVRCP